MNGNVSNTVSPKQVQAIAAAIDAATAAAKVKAENAGSGLFSKWKGLWADVKSVATAEEVGNLMEDSIQQLAKGANMLKDGVVNVGNFYARKAGKPSMNAPHTSFNAAFNPKVVEDTFDGDEYGFKDPTAVSVLIDEIQGLVNAFVDLAQETSDKITSINAFGNPEIKAQLLSAANRTYDNLTSAAKRIQTYADAKINEAARLYNIGDVGSYFKDNTSTGEKIGNMTNNLVSYKLESYSPNLTHGLNNFPTKSNEERQSTNALADKFEDYMNAKANIKDK